MAPELMTADAVIRTDTPRSTTPLPGITGEPVERGGVPPAEASLCTMADLDQLVVELDDVDATLASLR